MTFKTAGPRFGAATALQILRQPDTGPRGRTDDEAAARPARFGENTVLRIGDRFVVRPRRARLAAPLPATWPASHTRNELRAPATTPARGTCSCSPAA